MTNANSPVSRGNEAMQDAIEMYALYLADLAMEVRESGTISRPQSWASFCIEYLCAELENNPPPPSPECPSIVGFGQMESFRCGQKIKP